MWSVFSINLIIKPRRKRDNKGLKKGFYLILEQTRETRGDPDAGGTAERSNSCSLVSGEMRMYFRKNTSYTGKKETKMCVEAEGPLKRQTAGALSVLW